jgi:hypothetical protein
VTRIVHINDNRARPVAPGTPESMVITVCCICEKMGATLADLDGPPFKAYYHPECLPADNCTWDGKPIDQGD